MSTEYINFTTPVGRLVQGSTSQPNTTDSNGAPLVYKTGPKAGQPRQDFFLGLAIRKDDPELPAFFEKLTQAAQRDWPGGQFNAPGFSWKYIDGDSVDANGQPYSAREGFAGHMIFKFSGSTPPQCYAYEGSQHVQIQSDQIKRGDYIQIYGSTSGNNSQQSPGIYLNHNMVMRVGFGEAIQTGPDAGAAFGAPPATLPPGASAMPTAPATPMATPVAPVAQPGVPGQPVAPVAQPGVPGQPAGVPGQPVTPNHGFVNNAGQ